MAENLIIIGSGPAGFTAGIYAGRAQLSPLLITGSALGGQMSFTNYIENYPGFPEGITGQELVQVMQKQAERFGTRVEMDEVTGVDFSVHPFKVKTYAQEYEAGAVIIATGASPRKLGVPGEKEFAGKGVSYCATCDGFFYQDRTVIVVGGGDSAIEEAMFLTKYRPTTTFDSFFDTFDRGFFPVLRSWTRGEDGEAFEAPRTNINETDSGYVITMELPGVQKKDVDVAVDGEELVVTAERSEKSESEGLLRCEIRSVKFRRSFTLGRTVDRENIEAKLEDGILKVTLAKKAESVGRKIDVS